MKNWLFIFYALLCVILCKCSQNSIKPINNPILNPTKQYDNTNLKSFRQEFGLHFFHKGSSPFLLFLDSKDSINIFHFTTNEVIKRPFNRYVTGLSEFNVSADDSSLFIFDRKSKFVSKFLVIDTGIVFKEYYDFSKNELVNLHILPMLPKNPFVVQYPYLFFQYQDTTKDDSDSRQFYGDSSYLMLTLSDSSKSSIRLPVPKSYLSGEAYLTQFFLYKLASDTFVYLFSSTDDIYITKPSQNLILKSGKLPFFNGYKKFKQSKVANLAYVREYLETVEINVLGGVCGNYIWVLKRNKKQNPMDTSKFSLIILDKNLRTIKKYNLDHYCDTGFSTSTEIFLLDTKFSKIYAYEIN